MRAAGENRKQFELFAENRDQKLQQIFDSLAGEPGDLFTARHKFGNDPLPDNTIGDAIGLAPDNPDAAPGEAQFTDPRKLARIHDIKQVNLLGDILRLKVDKPAAGPGEIKFIDPDKRRQIDHLRGLIRKIGGADAVLTLTAGVYTAPTAGVLTTYLLRVEGDRNRDGEITREETTRRPSGSRGSGGGHLDDEDMIIDLSVVDAAANGANLPWKYDDFGDFQKGKGSTTRAASIWRRRMTCFCMSVPMAMSITSIFTVSTPRSKPAGKQSGPGPTALRR